MYVRFTTRCVDVDARSSTGVFTAAYDLFYDRSDLAKYWQMDELRRVLDWFNDHLSTPQRFFYRPGSKSEISGVCWFRDSAKDHVSQARYLAWLVSDLGTPVEELRHKSPGRILWEDEFQVVASKHLKN
ncbi:hypothetical protein [Leisingera sp. ANG-Vp]|uniref:hypothetical protein n=1 Tax=Leisingera sp. ANG-Vp TaxID=1577896 RepID=UPI00057F9888|nr:hypothetical protein [Leisingera sp. ANG-Vp]KIC18662.1 hypothetical protein RA20_13590 [Leisingera sp. ANG-Vp]